MQAELRHALTAALRARDPVAVAALRSALSALDNATAVDAAAAPPAEAGPVAGGVRGPGAGEVPRRVPTPEAERAILRDEVDERVAAARAYAAAGRGEQAARLRAEADVLAPFLERHPVGDYGRDPRGSPPDAASRGAARRPGSARRAPTVGPDSAGRGGHMEPTIGVTPPRVMTIAGTDSGGGAGVAADLRALAACGVHGCVAVTAVTVQNSLGVTGVHTIPPETVAAQIEAVATDIGLDAAKTGMLATTGIIRAVDEACGRVGIGGGGPVPFVVDPVAASMHGDPLLAADALDAYRELLFARATLVTPNLDEVRLFTGIDVHDRAGQHEAAKVLHALGPRWVLVKGGHLAEDTDTCVDLLYGGDEVVELPGPRYAAAHTDGSGDSMASAIAAFLARGRSVPEAVALGKRFVTASVHRSYPLGGGHGPVSPLWAVERWWEPA